jgi:hypothetical protein
LNVQEFGALGDGRQDNLAALNRAIAALVKAGGGKLEFPAGGGVFGLKSVWIITATNVDIEGHGCTLLMLPGSPTDASGDLVRPQDCHGLKFHGFTLDGGVPRAWTEIPDNIRILRGSDIELYDVRSVNAPCDDLFIWGGGPLTNTADIPTNVRVHDFTFMGAPRSGISVVGAAFCRIDHGSIRNAGPHSPACAVDVEPNTGDVPRSTHDVQIDHLIAENCPGGIHFAGVAQPYNLSALSCNLDGCREGIQVFQAGGTQVLNNTITGGLGIGVNSCDGCVVTGNNTDGMLYADTAGIATPKPHRIAGNVTHSVGGVVTAKGNLQR